MKKLILLYFLLLSLRMEAQEPPIPVQRRLEQLAETDGVEGRKDDELLEQLDDYHRHPLSVNRAGPEELAALRLLSPIQVGSLIRYRNAIGPLVDLHELQAVPGWDIETIARAMPYLTVVDPLPPGRQLAARLHGGSTLLIRTGRMLQRAGGYEPDSGSHYLGSPDHLLISYKYQYRNVLYFGLTADKDPGEQLFRGTQAAGFDFYSLHFMARRLGRIKALALGDYTVNLGQGLLYWQSDRFGKSDAVLSATRLPAVLSPYRSAGETRFNRGIGVTVGWGRIEVTAFASYKRLSASVDSTDGHFGSLQTSGYYRTPAEIAHRYVVRQSVLGGSLAYVSGETRIALNAVAMEYGNPQRKDDRPYNYFAFSGRRSSGLSLDYAFTKGNAHGFGEAALDDRINLALLSGVLLSVSSRADLSFLYRHLPSAYRSPGGSAFTESSLPANEEGLYTGLVLRPAPGWQVNAYADIYRFPWLRYRVSAPSTGQDLMVLTSYQPGKKWRLDLRYRTRRQELDGDGQKLAAPIVWNSRNLRLHLTEQLNPGFAFKTRIELLWLQSGTSKEEGFLTYVEGDWKTAWGLSLRARLQYTETGSYASRVYAYESDVLYGFGIPAFSGKLYRYYLVGGRSFGRIGLWVRWAESIYPGFTQVGSGLDRTKGNRRSEIKLQAVCRFGNRSS